MKEYYFLDNIFTWAYKRSCSFNSLINISCPSITFVTTRGGIMTKTSIGNLRFFLSIVILFVGLLTVGIHSSKGKSVPTNAKLIQQPLAPSHSKYIGKYRTYPNEPIVIDGVKIKGNPVNINSKIASDESWLNGFSFKVRNISNKNIVYISLELIFPETKTDEPVLAFPLRYGTKPLQPNQASTLNSLAPNQEVEFTVSGSQYENLKRFIEHRTSIANINATNIDVVFVMFADDTGWATGAFMHRKPDDSAQWVDDN